MKKILVVALALVMCFALTAVASAKTYELKISTTQTDSSMIYQGLKAAADEIMEKTNGDVKVTIYPSSQLGGEEDMIDQAIAGIGVAVLDTGCFPHEDYKGRIAAFFDMVRRRRLPYDDNGHGTEGKSEAKRS